MPSFDRLSIQEVDLDHLLTDWNPRHYLLSLCVDDAATIRIGIPAVETEGYPTRLRLVFRFFEEWDVRNMLRRHRCYVIDVNVSVDSIDNPDLLLVGPNVDAVTRRGVRKAFTRFDLKKSLRWCLGFHTVNHFTAPSGTGSRFADFKAEQPIDIAKHVSLISSDGKRANAFTERADTADDLVRGCVYDEDVSGMPSRYNVSGLMSCSFGHWTVPNAIPTFLK